MSYKLALVFLVGLVALAGAVPVDKPEEDADLNSVLADPVKDAPLNEESVELPEGEFFKN